MISDSKQNIFGYIKMTLFDLLWPLRSYFLKSFTFIILIFIESFIKTVNQWMWLVNMYNRSISIKVLFWKPPHALIDKQSSSIKGYCTLRRYNRYMP